jgi:signal transduction histidine kinase
VRSLIYIRLIGFTAGTLLQLFWMVVILGYRRQRNFERVFFFLCLALFCFYGGSLLAVNAQVYYAQTPPGLRAFAATVITIGLCMIPALLMLVHMEFAQMRGLLKDRRWKFAVAAFFFAACLHTLILSLRLRIAGHPFDFSLPPDSLHDGAAHVFSYALIWGCAWEFRFWRTAPDQPQRRFHGLLGFVFVVALLGIVGLHVFPLPLEQPVRVVLSLALSLVPLIPLVALIYLVWRHNFLQIGRQKNLLYAVVATFFALMYLSLVRRVSGWLEPELPPEASAAVLLFVLVIFIEPLQRMLARTLQRTAQREMDRVQRVMAEIQQEARQGNLEALRELVERRVKETFELATVGVTFPDQREIEENRRQPGHEGQFDEFRTPEPRFELVEVKDDHFRAPARNIAGVLKVAAHGAALAGETRAALEFLCLQLPGAVDLCRLIEEKLRLERELAERERLAVLGQMAASISHNLKNPLGSIKTILQVQMESPDLPASMRGETKMILGEIGRLSAKLSQLLQFSRPVLRGGTLEATCEARIVVEEVVGVLRHEAEDRGVRLEFRIMEGNVASHAAVKASSEALSDVVTNLVINALEATSRGGQVQVEVSPRGDTEWAISVEDDGVGIPAALREKIVQPFYTTKSHGTGLGLAIVAKRVAEFAGKLEWVSPARHGKGTRFEVTIRAAHESHAD